jgi:hypothetical protein
MKERKKERKKEKKGLRIFPLVGSFYFINKRVPAGTWK